MNKNKMNNPPQKDPDGKKDWFECSLRFNTSHRRCSSGCDDEVRSAENWNFLSLHKMNEKKTWTRLNPWAKQCIEKRKINSPSLQLYESEQWKTFYNDRKENLGFVIQISLFVLQSPSENWKPRVSLDEGFHRFKVKLPRFRNFYVTTCFIIPFYLLSVFFD